MDLPEFLLAMFAEDEESARCADVIPAPAGFWDDDRVIAECNAKRRVVEHYRLLCEQANGAPEQHIHAMLASQATGLGVALRLLALPYASHPDYRAEWRP